MGISQKAVVTEGFDRVRHQEFVERSDRAFRDMILGCDYPGYPFHQVGTNLHPCSMLGRGMMLAAAVGAAKHQVLAPVQCLIELHQSLYPASARPNWRAASIATEPHDAAVDAWQTRTGPDASDFELRRGIELAYAENAANEKLIADLTAELGRRTAERHQERRQLRSSVGR